MNHGIVSFAAFVARKSRNACVLRCDVKRDEKSELGV